MMRVTKNYLTLIMRVHYPRRLHVVAEMVQHRQKPYFLCKQLESVSSCSGK